MMTPVGAGITALGLGKMGIEAAMDEREKILGMTEEERTNYLADQYESFGGVFGEGASMDRRTFMKLMGSLAAMPIVGRIAKPLRIRNCARRYCIS